MNEAIWYVIQDAVVLTTAAMISTYAFLTIFQVIFGGQRNDFWAAWHRNKGSGGVGKLDNADRLE